MVASTNLARLPGLRYFVEVVQHGSFRRAAEDLHIAPSAINRQISNLEARLGVALFHRDRGRAGVRLTEAGEIFHYRCVSILNELAIAHDEINALKGLQHGHLRLGINEVLAADLLPGLLSDLHGKFSGLTFSVMVENTPEIVRRLRDGDVDIGLGYNFPLASDLEILATMDRRAHLIAALDHRLARRRAVRIADVANEKFILPHTSVSLRRMLDEAFAAANLQIVPLMVTNSFSTLRQSVQNGLGVSIVIGRFLERQPEELAFVKLKEPLIKGGSLSCCRIRGRTPSYASIAFSDSIMALFSRYSGRSY